MGCSYWGTSSEQAQYQADVCNYNDTAAKLNAISSNYNNLLNLSSSHFQKAAQLQARSKALSSIGEWGASIAIASKSKKALKDAEKAMSDANIALTSQSYVKYIARARPIIVGYMTGGAPRYKFYFDIGSVTINRTYQEAIAYADDLSDFLSGYSSWSFGFSFGGGSAYYLLSAANISTLLNLTLDGAHSIGIISDSDYKKIKKSPLWQIALVAVASYGLSYGLQANGYKNTPLGYTDNAGYDALMTPDVENIFTVISVASTLHQLYKAYTTDYEQKSLKNSSSKIEDIKKYSDTDVYESGEYYKVFAGQELFNFALAGHDGYVPTSTQIPSWGIVEEKLHDEDEFSSQVMNQNRNATMAGGGGFLNTLTQGAIPLSR